MFLTLQPQELPIGVYLVRPDGSFLLASPSVCRLLGQDGQMPPESALPAYFASPQEFDRLLIMAQKHPGGDAPVRQQPVRMRGPHGEVYAEITCKPLRDPNSSETLAYYGCLVDREKVTELTADIGRVLHANNNTLNMVRLALDPVIEILSRELEMHLDGSELNGEQETTLLDRGTQKLAAAIQHFFEVTSEEMRKKALPPLRWEYLAQTTEKLKNYQKMAPVAEARPSFLRYVAKDVVSICGEIKPGYLPKEAVRELQRSALYLQKAAAIIPITNAFITVTQMDQPLQALRDYVTSDSRAKEEWAYVPLRQVLDAAMATLSEFAHSRKVDVRVNDYVPGVQVTVLPREAQRAFTNLLHNAIKYSWRHVQTQDAWVQVEIRATETEASVSFVNWGVPIAKDEIDSGILFNLGYRGRLSKDRNRLGTGIGLTDARQTARQHGGNVIVESHPATFSNIPEGRPGYYEQPFITRVTITFSKNPDRMGGT